jgi:hypothetical protein
VAEADRDAFLADGEQLGFRAIDRLLDVGWILVPDLGDLAGRRDQVPQHRLALDDARVLDRVDGGRRLVAQAGQVRPPADRIELAVALEDLGDSDDVHGLAPLEQLEHRAEDRAVRRPVEVIRTEELGHLDDRVPVDQHGAEDRLFGFDALRREAIDHRRGPRDGRARSCRRGGRKRYTTGTPRRRRVHELGSSVNGRLWELGKTRPHRRRIGSRLSRGGG